MAKDKHISRKETRRLMREARAEYRAEARERRRPCERSEDHDWFDLIRGVEQCSLCGASRQKWNKRRTPPAGERMMA